MAKPSLPQGMRDFPPETVRKRDHIFQIIRRTFELYGFQPLETPAMENIETLLGKYGEEGDRLIFRVLNNGLADPANQAKARTAFEHILQGKNDRNLTERALRYDLTIPFARYVAMHHGQITFPFKRYQLQPVWRADRPQKGRYREFYQCDADIVGSNSLLNEVEFALIYHQVFTALGITGYRLRVNSRKILTALAEKCGNVERFTDITIAIDKLDKVGLDQVKQELADRGLDPARIHLIEEYLRIGGSNSEKLLQIKALLGDTSAAPAGISELEFLLARIATVGNIPLEIDFTLARGLDYYTGIIFEAKAPTGVNIGSIGGGGRYDDLTGLFGVPGIPGVGISFGVDRIYDVMEEMNLFPLGIGVSTQALFLNAGEKESEAAFVLMQSLRDNGIRCELFHASLKVDKQYRYAEKNNIPYVIIIGAGELSERNCKVKDIRSGEIKTVQWEELGHFSFK